MYAYDLHLSRWISEPRASEELSHISISSHFSESSVRRPGPNLFSLIACNCSVDVYFLISSNITGVW